MECNPESSITAPFAKKKIKKWEIKKKKTEGQHNTGRKGRKLGWIQTEKKGGKKTKDDSKDTILGTCIGDK